MVLLVNTQWIVRATEQYLDCLKLRERYGFGKNQWNVEGIPPDIVVRNNNNNNKKKNKEEEGEERIAKELLILMLMLGKGG